MRIQATTCPNCGANVTLVVDRYNRCEGQCGACDRMVMTSLSRIPAREPTIAKCLLCGGQPIATTFVDHGKRRFCAINCLTCNTALISTKGDIFDKWNVTNMPRITPAEFYDRVKTDMTEDEEESE